ncbi:MAG: aspartate carbamoyltransferase catalytic subunit [Bdellovibrionales bacterium]|nr:aspartate carbamoyltransferase catalytic subunit [Bdellovibrionales bacterium]
MIRHLLGIEGLTLEELEHLLLNAASFVEVSKRDIKKVPSLRGKTIINFFMEPSTRTRTSFEIAGKRLSADTINVSGSSSSVVKGETLLDTARSLEAMNPDAIVVRHKASGAPHFLARHLSDTVIINAGDGMHEHPTQALLDCLSLQQHFVERPQGIKGLTIAIVGDIRHSRVVRSNIWAHKLLGNKVRLVAPPTLIPPEFLHPDCFGDPSFLSIHHKLEEGLEGVDVIMGLRLQMERQSQFFIPSVQEYTNEYFVSSNLVDRLAPQAVVLHPGPVNRGVEIATDLVDGPRSLVSRQVNNGVAVRMAVLFACCTGDRLEREEAA